jgi:hypothetical protein
VWGTSDWGRLGYFSDQRSLNLGTSEAVSLLIHINILTVYRCSRTPARTLLRSVPPYFYFLFPLEYRHDERSRVNGALER